MPRGSVEEMQIWILPRRGIVTKPRIGRVFCGLPWVDDGRDFYPEGVA